MSAAMERADISEQSAARYKARARSSSIGPVSVDFYFFCLKSKYIVYLRPKGDRETKQMLDSWKAVIVKKYKMMSMIIIILYCNNNPPSHKIESFSFALLSLEICISY